MGVITEHPKVLLTHRVSGVVTLYENKVEEGSLFVTYDQNIKSPNFLHKGICKSNKIIKYNNKNSSYYAQILVMVFIS